jgi:hypothetical protein
MENNMSKIEIIKQTTSISISDYRRMAQNIKEGYSFFQLVNIVRYKNRRFENRPIDYIVEKVRYLQFKRDNFLIEKIKQLRQEENIEKGEKDNLN